MRVHRSIVTLSAAMAVLGSGLALWSAPAFAVTSRLPLSFSPFGSFVVPGGVAVDQSSGNVFVADASPGRVAVFSAVGGVPAGGIPAELTGAQTPAGEFKFNRFQPGGVAIDDACFQHKLSGAACTAFDASNGAIYVSDVAADVVDKFRINGSNEYEYVCQFTGFGFVGAACLKNEPSVDGTPTEPFEFPMGVAVDREGNVYVAIFGSVANFGSGAAIYEFNSAGEDVREIPSPSELDPSPEGIQPQDMAVDASGDIYVRGYQMNAGVVELKRSSFTGAVESEKVIVGAGSSPKGIAFDQATGRLFVDFPSSVVEYNEAGEAQAVFGSDVLSDAEDKGIAVNETTNDVYVVNRSSDQVDAFGPLVTLGSATTGAASSIGPNSATVEGTVNPESETLEGSCEVQYGKTTAYGQSVPCEPEKVGTGQSPVPVTANLPGLEANTLYHYRVVAINTEGKNPGPDETLTTLPAVEGVLTSEASEIGKTSATLNGSLNPDGIITHYYFEYGESEAYGFTSPAPPGTETEATETVPVAAKIGGLKVNTVYYFRLVATDGFGTTYGEPRSFATVPEEPRVIGESAARVSPREALLGAVVDPEGNDTTYHFLYGPTAGYGSSAPANEVELGGGGVGLQTLQSVSGLQPDTTYHYAVVATNVGGTAVGPDQTFTTPAAAVPVVVTGAASEVSQNGASISGSVDPQGVRTTYEFDIGTDTTYGTRISGEVGEGTEARTLTLNLLGLAAGTLYHYRLVATNTYGTVYGADETFTTPGFPTALLLSSVEAPLVPAPAFTPPSIAGAITVKATKPKAKSRKRPAKRRGGKARRASHGHASVRSGR
jgi:NHL repeat